MSWSQQRPKRGDERERKKERERGKDGGMEGGRDRNHSSTDCVVLAPSTPKTAMIER